MRNSIPQSTAASANKTVVKTGGGQAYILNVAIKLGIRLGCPMERAFAIQGLVAVVSRFNSQAILIFHAADFGKLGVSVQKLANALDLRSNP